MTRARTTRPGTVRFVGGGPGNAGMLTCRAREVLAGNALVFADADVSADVLALVATEVPVRQLLEQIVAKLGLPPFLLGLSWSSTERMSSQQSDLLTGELESYRRLLTPVLAKIAGLYLRSQGFAPEVAVEWAPISLQDETEEATARLTRAKAEELERKLAHEAKQEGTV